MEIKNKNAYIFILSILTATINLIFFFNSISFERNIAIFLSLFFSFSIYFLIYYFLFFILSLIFYRLPFFLFFLFFFFFFSSFPHTYIEFIIYLILCVVFVISILSTNFFDNFFSFEIPKGFYPILYFLTILILFTLKIFEKELSKAFYTFVIFFLVLFLILFIFISKYIKFPLFLLKAGIFIFLIIFFLSFFYFFPFNPPPYERKGQNFLIITIEGLRNDSILKTEGLKNFKEKGAYFSAFYLSSPDSTENLNKLLYQKNKFLLDFYPERYETFALIPEEMKNLDIIKRFKGKKFFNEKDFYSKTLSNLLFLVVQKKDNKITYSKIFDLAKEKLDNINKPFFIWLHIENLKYSIPEEMVCNALKGKVIDKNLLKEIYFNEVSKLDYHLSKFINNLEKNKWFEKTNILILGVSGYEMLEHSKIGTGTGYYQESILVPFLWIGPNILKKEINLPVSLLDIYPTILKKFNLSDDYKNFEGIEFTPAFENIFPLDRIFTFSKNKLFFKAKAFIKEDKKIIIYEGGKIEAYDLNKDPQEMENIILLKEEKIMKLIEEVKKL